jgi:hypothetical protein
MAGNSSTSARVGQPVLTDAWRLEMKRLFVLGWIAIFGWWLLLATTALVVPQLVAAQ